MESSPLTLAHSHARNALFETRKSNPVAASEEHDLAAGEFSTAAQGTLDPDALRTLQLLEKHHKRLAEILRFQHEHPVASCPESVNSPPSTLSTAQHIKFISEGVGGGSSSVAAPSLENTHQPPRLPTQHRSPQRDTSSIASNLASARGIPSHPPRGSLVSPTVSAQNAGAQMAGAPLRTRLEDTSLDTVNAELKALPSMSSRRKPSWAPTAISPTDIVDQQAVPPEPTETRRLGFGFPKDESFQRFYSTFEGLISKLSGPLAFASLPLGIDPASQKSGADTKLDRSPASADTTSHFTEQPDVNKLVSGAALRALRGREGSNGSAGHTNPAESFYVVPTAGGTISYAGILSRAEKEARRNSLGDSHDDDFVDARENPLPPESSATATASNRDRKATGGRRRGGAGGALERSTAQAAPHPNTKTLEELQMENQALKHLSDTLSKRLHMWEVNAQSSSLALQQSLKAMQHQSASSPARQLSPMSSATPQVSHAQGTQSTSPLPPAEGAAAGLQPSSRAGPGADAARLMELEERARRSERELQRVGRENEKLRDVVGRYRDRWEKLKEGARVRREGGNGGGGNTNNGGDKGKPVEKSKSAATAAPASTTAVEEGATAVNRDGANSTAAGGGAAGGGGPGGGSGAGEGERKRRDEDESAKGLLDD
ncbi:uncharacterized protein BDCG_07907 [Blastomyces dermatitidis ER-3]|uniref:Uncharacterized protein n=1 Tax=Ajellomyces dermatitidis (strain ER-3 / ATCC MYA-2586) TaxID=559297 RepID=A0ABP2ENK6_AJEDR|nr:uncharacterized protein BDCG_07907 [Blastomyces dermatitidis ER-3]EEQ84638.1 hypothetical protein BDCG_07907 [Blastomyces dermatitidis ER-3]